MLQQLIKFFFILMTGLVALTFVPSSVETSFLVLLLVIGLIGSLIGTLAGGAALVTLPAMLMLGVPVHTTIATNKFSSGLASFSSVILLLRSRAIRWQDIRNYILLSLIGGVAGASIASLLSESTMNVVVLVLLLFALVVAAKGQTWTKQIQTPNRTGFNKKALLIGLYDGGFGPGSSTFSILLFLKAGYSYLKAAQMSRVFNFGSCLGAFVIFSGNGYLQWDLAVALATGSIIGTQLGLKIIPKIPMHVAKWLLVTILVLLVGQVGIKFI